MNVMNRVDEIAVAAEEVNLRAVLVGIVATERGGIRTCTCCCSSQTKVAVGIDGELGVGAVAKGEGEPDVLH